MIQPTHSAPLQTIDPVTFEREYRDCILQCLQEGAAPHQSRASILRSEELLSRLEGTLGVEPARRLAQRVLERVAAVPIHPRAA